MNPHMPGISSFFPPITTEFHAFDFLCFTPHHLPLRCCSEQTSRSQSPSMPATVRFRLQWTPTRRKTRRTLPLVPSSSMSAAGTRVEQRNSRMRLRILTRSNHQQQSAADCHTTRVSHLSFTTQMINEWRNGQTSNSRPDNRMECSIPMDWQAASTSIDFVEPALLMSRDVFS